MTEQWRGLHNEDQHEYPSDSGAYCRTCAGVVCWEDTPCYCCLAAEVEALRGEVNLIELSCGDWKKRALAAEAQVQRVREVLADYEPFPDSLTLEVFKALDGGEVPLNNYGDDIVYLDGGDA